MASGNSFENGTKRKVNDIEPGGDADKRSEEIINHPAKKPKTTPAGPLPSGTKAITGSGLSSLKKAKKDPSQRTKPVSRRQERTPPRQKDPSPAPLSRSPSRSPPRQRKRPGASGRVSAADAEAVRKRQEERERAARDARAGPGGHDVVAQHYNAVPERGRDFRKSESKIKGLRSFNNWIKSVVIQKFSPSESYAGGHRGHLYEQERGLAVLDIGCGKGGDLQKWQSAPQTVDVYVGLDPAAVSVDQARDRYRKMPRELRYGEFRGRPLYHAEFAAKDCFGSPLQDIPIVQQIGLDYHTGPGSRGGGFDVVSMMFCMHYAFIDEEHAHGMLKNVSAALKKGGRFLGVAPNSDVLSSKIKALVKGDKMTPATLDGNSSRRSAGSEEGEWDPEVASGVRVDGLRPDDDDDADDDDWDPEKPAGPQSEINGETTALAAEDDEDDDWDPEKPSQSAAKPATDSSAARSTAEGSEAGKTDGPLEWGNQIYSVKFPDAVPKNGIFRPFFGWKYYFFLEEAVEVPEFVVPWEAFRAMAIKYDLELQYRKPFLDIWASEKNEPAFRDLSERMGVRNRDTGALDVSKEELEASSFYHAFCFVKQ